MEHGIREHELWSMSQTRTHWSTEEHGNGIMEHGILGSSKAEQLRRTVMSHRRSSQPGFHVR